MQDFDFGDLNLSLGFVLVWEVETWRSREAVEGVDVTGISRRLI